MLRLATNTCVTIIAHRSSKFQLADTGQSDDSSPSEKPDFMLKTASCRVMELQPMTPTKRLAAIAKSSGVAVRYQ